MFVLNVKIRSFASMANIGYVDEVVMVAVCVCEREGEWVNMYTCTCITGWVLYVCAAWCGWQVCGPSRHKVIK